MIFRRARMRLTLSFALVQLAIVAAFAIGVYLFVASAFDYDAPPGEGGLPSERGLQLLEAGLLWTFIALVVVTPVVAWMLAGMALRPVRIAYEAQQRFVDDASHELRTPLAAARTELELSQSRRRPDTEHRAAMRRALSSLDTLQSTLTDLLSSSRADREPLGDRVDVTDLVIGIGTLFPDDADRVVTQAEPGLEVTGSSAGMRRVLINLVGNALRFSSDEVTVRASKRGGDVVIEVADSGVGRNPAQARRAFDRFWQADPSRATSGSGLGLTIVREIVARHRGGVWLRSKPGQGTVVTVRIPLTLVSRARS
ncbi:MAG: sensor histidine kinase [Pseudolysinimonas sp.]